MTRNIAIEKSCQRATELMLWTLLIWVPLPLGSNRPIFWAFNGLFSAAIVCIFLLGNARHLGSLPNLKLTAWIIAGFGIVVAWMLLQSIPIASSALSHPLRSRLSEGIPKAYAALSANPADTLITIAEFTPPVILGSVAALIGKGSRHGVAILRVVVFWATVLAGFGLSALYWDFRQIFLIDSNAYAGSLTSTFVGRGAAATYFAIALVCAAALLFEKIELAVRAGRGPPAPLDFLSSLISRHGLNLAAIAVLLSALLNTGSRAGVVSGLAGLFVVGAASWHRLASAGVRGGAVILIVSLAIGVVGVSSTHLVQRLETIDPAADVRFLLYKDTIRMITERPMLGHGAGVFADVYPVYQSAAVPVSRVWNKAHNTYLQAACELGLPVLLLFMSLALACIWRIVRCVATCRMPAATAVAALGTFTVAALHSTFDFSLQIQAVALTFAVVGGAGYGEANRVLFESGSSSKNQVSLAESPTAPTSPIAVVTLLLVGMAMTVVSTSRLALVVSAEPRQAWLAEISPLIMANDTIEPATVRRAEAVSNLIHDPGLVTARLVPCRARQLAARTAANAQIFQSATKDCLDILEDALVENPFSGELWLERSKLLFRFQPGFSESLRRSYETSTRVGWIAAERVIVGIRVYRFLPEDLKNRVREDLALIIGNPELAGPLIGSFVADDSFRDAALPMVESLDLNEQRRFLELVKNRVNARK